jgi:signal transduction histidine kinase
MTGLWLKYGKTQGQIEELEDEVTRLSTERDETRKNLEEEIKRLKSIKWWQFWRR